MSVGRNFHRSTNASGQLYGRARGGRGRGPADEGQSARSGTRTISQSQQLPKLPSQSTDQNLSDVGNEEWETASESSDVLAHHHTHDAKSEDSKSSASREPAAGGRRDTKKTFASFPVDRNLRDNLSESRSGGFSATDGRNGHQNTRSSSSGNGRASQRGNRDQASSRSSTASVTDATNKSVLQSVTYMVLSVRSALGFSRAPGIPAHFHSRIPGNEKALIPGEKREHVFHKFYRK